MTHQHHPITVELLIDHPMNLLSSVYYLFLPKLPYTLNVLFPNIGLLGMLNASDSIFLRSKMPHETRIEEWSCSLSMTEYYICFCLFG